MDGEKNAVWICRHLDPAWIQQPDVALGNASALAA